MSPSRYTITITILLLASAMASAQETALAPLAEALQESATQPAPAVRRGRRASRRIGSPESATPNPEELDDLDKLLNMADDDVKQLSTVPVNPYPRAQISAPAPVAASPPVEQFTPAPSLQTQVTSVNRQETSVGRTPAAVSVVTGDMIRRAGVRTVPEALRMVPGVQVARIDANKWAISIRGFNERFANKLLVQIDGRPVYTPLFGGTFWDVQDLVLEDIDRIEVIRGPGATVWGANAVNGVINITTKNTRETTGLLVQGGAGTEERGFTTARYGEQVTEDFSYRVYGKWFDREEAFLPQGLANDDWHATRGGFRTDWQASEVDHITVQGDFYRGMSGERSFVSAAAPPFSKFIVEDQNAHGGNVLARWSKQLSEDSSWDLMAYYDRTDRDFQGAGFNEDRKTFDIDFQHRFTLGEHHKLIWGTRYRNTKDSIQNGFLSVGMRRPERADDLLSYFIQDEIQLFERLYLTLGSKFYHDDYTGFEYQPTARLLWAISPKYSAWASVSRAVRSPSRALDDVELFTPPLPGVPPGVFPLVTGSRTSQAEESLAWELGVRGQPNEFVTWDLAAFYTRYDSLVGTAPGALFFDPSIPGPVLPLNFNNDDSAETYGFEFMTGLKLTDNWRAYASYSLLRLEQEINQAPEGRVPRNQIYLSSSVDIGSNWQYDIMWRYVDRLSNAGIPSYNALDMRLAWLPSSHFELAVVGRNLLDQSHPEFEIDTFTGNLATEIEREVYGMVTLRW